MAEAVQRNGPSPKRRPIAPMGLFSQMFIFPPRVGFDSGVTRRTINTLSALIPAAIRRGVRGPKRSPRRPLMVNSRMKAPPVLAEG